MCDIWEVGDIGGTYDGPQVTIGLRTMEGAPAGAELSIGHHGQAETDGPDGVLYTHWGSTPVTVESVPSPDLSQEAVVRHRDLGHARQLRQVEGEHAVGDVVVAVVVVQAERELLVRARCGGQRHSLRGLHPQHVAGGGGRRGAEHAGAQRRRCDERVRAEPSPAAGGGSHDNSQVVRRSTRGDDPGGHGTE
ncbi:hypothetical protein [Streptomyces sp. NPDC052015]|uniref:hypothetical protein n=1 Tax=Streptomyces sp. NPDC052015 TaxID=3154755 RepID=UPI00343103E6